MPQVKKTLLDAKSISSVDPEQGSVGGIAQAALDKLGISDQVKPKLKWVKGGDVVQDQVAKGEIEIALGPYLSDMKNPGVDVVGPLPPGASTPVDITGFLSKNLKDTKDAKALLDEVPNPTIPQIRDALGGNLCRCTGYVKMIEAILLAAQNMRGDAVEVNR